MTTLREAAQLLLTRWDETDPVDRHYDMVDGILALGKALEQPEPAPEPVAWMQKLTGVIRSDWYFDKSGYVPLYTAPPQRKPLTNEQIDDCFKQAYKTAQGRNLELAFARAIERAHGIGVDDGKQ